MSQLMECFERDFENLDVQLAARDSSLAARTMLKAPQERIDQLMHQVADEVCRCLS